ncbi:MAG: hypothetical protein QGD90_00990 [Candidatus Hydrogenedentes bacterium]|nr:hypothetical protein [Candidatus Hydrogenedentota bacterium]
MSTPKDTGSKAKASKTGGRQMSFWSHNEKLIDRAHRKAQARAERAGLRLTSSSWRDAAVTAAAKAELETK